MVATLPLHQPAERATTVEPAPVGWGAEFRARAGEAKAAELEGSPWWPSLIDVVNQGLEAGGFLQDLLSVDGNVEASPSGDQCLVLLRRAQQLTTSLPDRAGEPSVSDQRQIKLPEQRAEDQWRACGAQTNPAVVNSEHWPAIVRQLDRIDTAIVDIDRLAQKLHDSPANLIPTILKDLNDSE